MVPICHSRKMHAQYCSPSEQDFPGIYAMSLPLRCFSEDGTRVICTSQWRSRTVSGSVIRKTTPHTTPTLPPTPSPHHHHTTTTPPPHHTPHTTPHTTTTTPHTTHSTTPHTQLCKPFSYHFAGDSECECCH